MNRLSKNRVILYLAVFVLLAGVLFQILPDQVYGAGQIRFANVSKTQTLAKGEKKTLKLKNVYGKIKWKSSKTSVVSVTGGGKVKARKKGRAVITAYVKGDKGNYATCKVTVGTKVAKLSFANIGSAYTISKAQKKKIKVKRLPTKVSNKKVKWRSSDSGIVTVTSRGVMKGIKKGTAVITAKAKDGSGKKAVCKVTVGRRISSLTLKNMASKMTVKKGASFSAKAIIKPTSASNKKLSWTSSNKKIATVSSTGKVTAKKNGTTKIKAKATDGSGKYKIVTIKVVTLIKDIKIKECDARVGIGQKLYLDASITPESASNKDLKWISSNAAVATASESGGIIGKTAGTVTITAQAKDGTRKNAKYKVQVVDLKSTETKFIAHRGYSAMAPENSIPAFQLANRYKFWGMETDVWENESYIDKALGSVTDLMVMHDKDIKRMCGKSLDIEKLNLNNRSKYPLLNGANVSRYTKSQLTVPNVNEYLNVIGSGNKTAVIEIKTPDISNGAAIKLLAAAKADGLLDRTIIASFYKADLKTFNSLINSDVTYRTSNIKLMYLKSSEAKTTVDEAVSYCRDNNIEILGLSRSIVNQTVVNKVHTTVMGDGSPMEIGVWTVDNVGVAKEFTNMGVDYLTTNTKIFND